MGPKALVYLWSKLFILYCYLRQFSKLFLLGLEQCRKIVNFVAFSLVWRAFFLGLFDRPFLQSADSRINELSSLFGDEKMGESLLYT